MKGFVVLSLLFTGAVLAQERPADYSHAAPIATEGLGSHYRFALPAAAYRGMARRDLGDLRIFNAAGEPVPYAFAPREPQKPEAATRPLRLFPLYAEEEGTTLDGAAMRVERSANGTIASVSIAPGKSAPARRLLLGYLVDASDLKAPKDALLLNWNATGDFSGQAYVEGSDDLKSWRATGSSPILRLKHQRESLERNRVELAGSRAKYLRLSFSGVPRSFALKEIRAELRPQRQELVREWLELEGTETKPRAELVFDVGGHFPVDRLRLVLPQLNTVAQVQFYTRERAEDPWRFVSSSVAYRIARDGAEVTSADAVLVPHSDRFWRVRADEKGGGLGSGQVKLAIGWLPHEVAFAARGDAPFSLAYGNKEAKPGALPVSSVLPKLGEDDEPKTLAAKVGEARDLSQPQPSLFTDPRRFLGGLTQDRDTKKWLLWAALVAGVLLLAWMAMKLLRDLGKSGGG